jgi:Ring finger domain
LTVALLVKKGFCSYEAKAEYASRNVQPKGVVKFLIIDGETRILNENYNHEDGGRDGEEDYSLTVSAKSDKWMSWWRQTQLSSTTSSSPSSPSLSNSALSKFRIQSSWNRNEAEDAPSPNVVDENTESSLVPFPKDDKSAKTLWKLHDNDVSVALLHVSYRTGYELLGILLNESVDVKMQGGTRVNLDGSSPTVDRVKLLIWVSLCVLVALSACCCLAAAISNLLESQQPEQQPSQRPRRRRLTVKQVKEMIPIGIFNGTELIFENEAFDSNTGSTESRNEDDDDNILQPSKSFPRPQSLDACTICLEEYAVGEKVRCLPCNHCFHARCICKWLVERSATCPLCKIDLYVEEEEEDEDDDEAVENGGTTNAAETAAARRTQLAQSHLPGLARVFISNDDRNGSSSWASVPPETVNVPTVPQGAAGGNGTAEASHGESISWWRRARRFGRSIFYSHPTQREETEGAINSLSEPLLGDHQSAEGQAETLPDTLGGSSTLEERITSEGETQHTNTREEGNNGR